MDRQEEKIIIERILSGDEKSLVLLYRKYHSSLQRFVNRKVGDSGEAEEITQDILVQGIEGLRDFRFQSSIKTFLFTIARNKVIDYYRRKKIKKVLFSSLPAFVVDSFQSVDMQEIMDKKALAESIEKTIASLPHEYQVVLRLKYLEGHSVRKIAEILVRTFKSTESLLFRARQAFVSAYNSNLSK